MSQFNAIGEYGLNDVLTKRLTTPGGSNAPSVAPEIFPVLTLENDRPEWIHLAGGGLFSKVVSITAVAAQYSMAQIYVPSDRRTIVVVENVRRSSSPTGINIARGVGISAGLGGWVGQSTAARDFRQRSEGSGAIIETTTNVALPTTFALLDLLETDNGEAHAVPFIVTPGTALILFGTAVNSTLRFTLKWRERSAQPGELV